MFVRGVKAVAMSVSNGSFPQAIAWLRQHAPTPAIGGRKLTT